MEVEQFLVIVREACELFSGSISSYHRTATRNRIVQGASNSAHLGWTAVDIVLDDWDRKDDCIHWLKAQNVRVLDEVASKNHLHVDDRIPTH